MALHHCQLCGKRFDIKEERYRYGFGKKKKKVCSNCFDEAYGTE